MKTIIIVPDHCGGNPWIVNTLLRILRGHRVFVRTLAELSGGTYIGSQIDLVINLELSEQIPITQQLYDTVRTRILTIADTGIAGIFKIIPRKPLVLHFDYPEISDKLLTRQASSQPVSDPHDRCALFIIPAGTTLEEAEHFKKIVAKTRLPSKVYLEEVDPACYRFVMERFPGKVHTRKHGLRGLLSRAIVVVEPKCKYGYLTNQLGIPTFTTDIFSTNGLQTYYGFEDVFPKYEKRELDIHTGDGFLAMTEPKHLATWLSMIEDACDMPAEDLLSVKDKRLNLESLQNLIGSNNELLYIPVPFTEEGESLFKQVYPFQHHHLDKVDIGYRASEMLAESVSRYSIALLENPRCRVARLWMYYNSLVREQCNTLKEFLWIIQMSRWQGTAHLKNLYRQQTHILDDADMIDEIIPTDYITEGVEFLNKHFHLELYGNHSPIVSEPIMTEEEDELFRRLFADDIALYEKEMESWKERTRHSL